MKPSVASKQNIEPSGCVAKLTDAWLDSPPRRMVVIELDVDELQVVKVNTEQFDSREFAPTDLAAVKAGLIAIGSIKVQFSFVVVESVRVGQQECGVTLHEMFGDSAMSIQDLRDHTPQRLWKFDAKRVGMFAIDFYAAAQGNPDQIPRAHLLVNAIPW